jgi:very-long-chain (3R)-3-hydroxyacyl-CoA dehydratase
MQVASRFLLVWIVIFYFPGLASASKAYSSMLFAWSLTEVIRYSYFAVNLAYGSVPPFLTWLRYNMFFVLYPLGISSECWLVWLSRGAGVKRFGIAWDWFCRLVLFVYIPGTCNKWHFGDLMLILS